MSGDVRYGSAAERAEALVRRELGDCNDKVNHDGREPAWIVEALAEYGLLVTDEVKAVMDFLIARHQIAEWRVWNTELAHLVDAAVPK